ncbi:MAG: ABC transporter substrate-binding protein [Mogibacterium sp.]|nr:ABC transporter substrate-binding protein [Mogibacterium sp.]
MNTGKTRRPMRRIPALLGILILMFLTGCGQGNVPEGSGSTGSMEEHRTGSMELEAATQFSADYFENGIAVIRIMDGRSYLLLPEGQEIPDWIPSEQLQEMTIIREPVEPLYLAASSAMDLFRALDALSAVRMTSTAASDWSIPAVRELVEADQIHYVGKYRAPDYEALLEEDIRLTIESTMIYHDPEVREKIESLGIPVLIERSSYENDPLGRLEWIRLYGLLLGKQEAADTLYQQQAEKIRAAASDPLAKPVTAAFFSVNASGMVVVRKPGDYVTRMIELAGGSYALADIAVQDQDMTSTTTVQMEDFYERAVDADCLLYNSTIEGDLISLEDLLEKSDVFRDFKAVREGNVWCTNKNVFQETTGTAEMIREMHAIFAGTAEESELNYFHKLN